MADAEQFCDSYGLSDHAPLFAKAALVARDPGRFESLAELNDDERSALVFERDHKFGLSGWLWYSTIICAVGAA